MALASRVIPSSPVTTDRFSSDSAFSRGLLARQNSSKNPFHFLNIYKSRAHGIASKIGGEAISAGMLPGEVGPIEGLSAGENVLNSTLNKDVAYNQQTARNTQIMADAMGNGGLGGGGGLRAAEREGGAAYAPQFRDPVIYEANSDWTPGALVHDFGAIAMDSSDSIVVSGLSLELPAGNYLCRYATDANGTQPVFFGWRGSPASGTPLQPYAEGFMGFNATSHEFGPAESPGTTWTSGINGSGEPLIYWMSFNWAQP